MTLERRARELARLDVKPWLKACGFSLLAWIALDLLFHVQWLSGYRERKLPVPWARFVADYAASVIWGLLTPAILGLVAWLPIERRRWTRAVPFHLAASLGAGLLFFLALSVYSLPLSVLLDEPSIHRAPSLGFAFRLLIQSVIFYAQVAAVGHGIHYYREYRDRDLRASRLEAMLAQAQLQVLRMQLHPHFLFNTLHTVSALMHADLRAADRILALLGDLLRESLDRVGAQEVTLKQELGFIDRYLEIEKTRFRDRLSVSHSVDPSLFDAWVPNLILQPLVENAIRHGISRRASAGRLEIEAKRSGDQVVLVVRDDGPGLPDEGPARGGVGLSNTRARLQQLYGAAHRFEIRNRERGGLEITLAFPLRLAAPDAAVDAA